MLFVAMFLRDRRRGELGRLRIWIPLRGRILLDFQTVLWSLGVGIEIEMNLICCWIAATFLACTGCPGTFAPRLCSSNVGRSVSRISLLSEGKMPTHESAIGRLDLEKFSRLPIARCNCRHGL